MIPRLHKGAFTVVEVLITIMILALLTTGLITLYRNSMQSYRVTSWKQERTRQAELFWNQLRKAIEEASDKLERQDLGAGRWTIAKTSRPLLFKAPPGDGKILAWQVDHYDPATGLVAPPLNWFLVLDNHRLLMPNQNMSVQPVLEDVHTVTIRATQIMQDNATFEEVLDVAGTGVGTTVGSVLEISILLTPPPQIQSPDTRLVQNAKFKLVVESQPHPAPNY